jgi:hypothetical protein
MLKLDYFRYPLTPGDGRPIAPGETVTVDISVPLPGKGSYLLDWDMVSESVSWFSTIGLVPVRVQIEVS